MMTDIREFYTTYEDAIAGLEEAVKVIQHQRIKNDMLEAYITISEAMLHLYEQRIKELEKGEKEDAE